MFRRAVSVRAAVTPPTNMWGTSLEDRVSFLESHHDRLSTHVTLIHDVVAATPSMKGSLEGRQLPKPKERFDMSAMAGVYSDMRNYFAQQPIMPTTLDAMLKVTNVETLRENAQYLHRELPVRLAHRVRDLDTFPYGLSHMSSIQKVKQWYVHSFAELRAAKEPITTPDLIAFHDTLSGIYSRHAKTIHMVSRGVQELKTNMRQPGPPHPLPDLQPMLDTFMLSRIGIRFLIGHYLTLCRSGLLPGVTVLPGVLTELELFDHDASDFVGLVCTRCNVRKIIDLAIRDVRQLTPKSLPTITTVFPDAPADTVVCVASDVYTILLELLKNAVRFSPAQILVRVMDVGITSEDVVISIEDQGPGIRRSAHIWSCLYTTSSKKESEVGEGFGLPLSRLHAIHFGGDLKIRSVEGVGTTAFVYIPRKTSQRGPHAESFSETKEKI